MTKANFVKPSRHTVKHLAQLLAAIIDVTTMGDPDDVVVPVAMSVSGDVTHVNDDCEFRAVMFPCEMNCWKGIDQPPVTKQVEIMTGSMLLYVCTECGGMLYIDTIAPREVRDFDYAEKRELAATSKLLGPMLNKKLHALVDAKRVKSRRCVARMDAKRRAEKGAGKRD